ncbi:MAG: RHS repeat protein, partial [Limnospira sp. PMC 1256.20]|uniref:RHS repeat domain-containing protein n=1 Tax=Limnospira sp. PMC 1256.20 TaxID=2981054 RepID=UPI0028E0F8F0
ADVASYGETAFILTQPDGEAQYFYDANGILREIRRSDGNRLVFTDVGVFGSAGGMLAIATDASGRVTGLTDAAGGRVLYQYDQAGRLASVV